MNHESHRRTLDPTNAFSDVGRAESTQTVGGTDVLRLMATISHQQAQSTDGDQTELSECDLATFDFQKCLG